MKISFEIKNGYIVWLVIIGILYFMAYEWTKHISFGSVKDDKNFAVSEAVETALGLPTHVSSARGVKEMNGVPPFEDNLKLAILKIPDEELHKIACKRGLPDTLKFKQACIYDEHGFAPGEYNGDPCPTMYQQLWECLSVTGGDGGYSDKGVEEELSVDYCGVWQRESCIALNVPEQVLDYPEVLKVIIKAAEQPCKFIPEEQQLSGRNPKLHCQDRQGRSPEKVIINFRDQDLYNKFHIITKRKE